jgi:Tfp pilus assembly protein PilN
MRNTLKNYFIKRAVLVCAVLLCFVFFGYFVFYRDRISVLEERNSVLEQSIQEREKRIAEMRKLVEILTLESKKVELKIIEIKKTEYEKIKIIDSMPVSGLQRYFTDRYKR